MRWSADEVRILVLIGLFVEQQYLVAPAIAMRNSPVVLTFIILFNHLLLLS